jgi:ABC-type cobalamin transport system ATPase subunit
MAIDGPPGCGKSTILAKVASLLSKSAVIQVICDFGTHYSFHRTVVASFFNSLHRMDASLYGLGFRV